MLTATDPAIAQPGEAISLQGVPETMLWPLWNRASEQVRSDRLIEDPLAAELVERLDYDFRGMFGRPSVLHAIRARVADDYIRDYARGCDGDPVVVSLGDGLDTQPWRVADGRIRWISVDLPEAIGVRKRLLPAHARTRLVACSVLDPSWIDEIPAGTVPFFCAAGLLMYFEERQVIQMLATIGDAFPESQLFFDTIPPWFSRKTLKGFKVTRRYTAPPMPWGVCVDDVQGFLARVPGICVHHVQTYADPFPRRTRLLSLLTRVPAVRKRFSPGLVLARSAKKTAAGYYD